MLCPAIGLHVPSRYVVPRRRGHAEGGGGRYATPARQRRALMHTLVKREYTPKSQTYSQYRPWWQHSAGRAEQSRHNNTNRTWRRKRWPGQISSTAHICRLHVVAVAMQPVLKPAGGSCYTDRYSARERAAAGGVSRRPCETISVERMMRFRRCGCGRQRSARSTERRDKPYFKISTTAILRS